MTDTDTEPARAAEPREDEPGPSKAPLIGAVVLALVGLAALGLLLADPFGGDAGDDGGGAGEVAHDAVAADVDVDGEPLPPFESPETDEAIGMPAPALEGTGLDGEPLVIDPADGTARVIVFVAHWCPVCQEELGTLQDAVEGGELHDDVELVAVSTGVREQEENFPPGDWFRSAGWTVPTLVDNEERHAAGSYGLQAYPYWVFTQGDGVVAGRLSGALSLEDLQLLMDELAARG